MNPFQNSRSVIARSLRRGNLKRETDRHGLQKGLAMTFETGFMKFILLIILLSIPAAWQIITPGYFPMHDDTQVVRVQQMYKAIQGGQFPVRWVPDLGYGYGYPIFNFYNPLSYYFGTLFMFLGADALTATKAMMAFGIILAGVSMFVFTRAVLKGSDLSGRSDPSLPALLAATLYIYAPYHGVQIYVRGSVAEYWAYAILPLVFYAIWKRKVILAGLSLAALITFHNLTAFMSIPFIVLLVIFRYFETLKDQIFWKDLILSNLLFLIFGLGLSAFFWMPAIFEANKTQVSRMVFENFDPPALHLIKPFQLWSGQWGYGGSSPGIDDGLSLQLGKVHVLGSMGAIVFFVIARSLRRGNLIILFSIIGLFFSLFMMLPFSAPIWNAIPVLSYIQFPWRFLTFASLFSSLLSAFAIWKILELLGIEKTKNKKQKTFIYLFFALCSLLFILYSFKFFQPQFKYPTTAGEQTSREKIVWEVSKRSDEYLPNGFERPENLEEALRGGNLYNQRVVDDIKKATPVRRLANTISLISLISLITLIPYAIFRRVRTA